MMCDVNVAPNRGVGGVDGGEGGGAFKQQGCSGEERNGRKMCSRWGGIDTGGRKVELSHCCCCSMVVVVVVLLRWRHGQSRRLSCGNGGRMIVHSGGGRGW